MPMLANFHIPIFGLTWNFAKRIKLIRSTKIPSIRKGHFEYSNTSGRRQVGIESGLTVLKVKSRFLQIGRDFDDLVELYDKPSLAVEDFEGSIYVKLY